MHMISSWDISKAKPTPAGLELYDLEKDPYEQQNVYGDPVYAEVAAKLKQRLLALKKEVGDIDEPYPELMTRREKAWRN